MAAQNITLTEGWQEIPLDKFESGQRVELRLSSEKRNRVALSNRNDGHGIIAQVHSGSSVTLVIEPSVKLFARSEGGPCELSIV